MLAIISYYISVWTLLSKENWKMVENCIIIANHFQSNFVQIAVGPITVLPVEIRTSIIMQIRTQKNKTKNKKNKKRRRKQQKWHVFPIFLIMIMNESNLNFLNQKPLKMQNTNINYEIQLFYTNETSPKT